MHRHAIRTLAFALAVASGLSTTVVAQGIGTPADPFGSAGGARTADVETGWGQTFKTPDATNVQLISWQYGLRSSNGGTAQLQIFEWAADALVGDALFTSAVIAPGPQLHQSFNLAIGVLLDPTKTYIALLNVAGGLVTSDIACMATCGNRDLYADGTAVLFRNTTPGSDITAPGTSITVGVEPALYDLAFQAQFTTAPTPPVTATPEPATLGLMTAGLGFVGVVTRRKRRGAK